MSPRSPARQTTTLVAPLAAAFLLCGWSWPAHAANGAEAACQLDISLKADSPKAKPEQWRECAQAPKGGSKEKAYDACEGFKSMASQNPDQTLKMDYVSHCPGVGLTAICRGAFGSVDRFYYQTSATQAERHRNGCATSGGRWELVQ